MTGIGRRIVLVDNYDSFTYNLYQYLCELGAEVTVARNDEIGVAEIAAGAFDGIVISPGPSRPENAMYPAGTSISFPEISFARLTSPSFTAAAWLPMRRARRRMGTTRATTTSTTTMPIV